jgi:hypothetical protein
MTNKSAGAQPELILRPNAWWRPSRAGNLAAAAGYLLASGFFLLRFHGSTRETLGVIDVVVLGLLVAGLRRSFNHGQLTLEDDRVIFSGALRTRALIGQSAPTRVIDAEVDWGRTSGRRSRLWMLVNRAGRAELALNRDAWDGAELERLRERLGIPLEVAEKPLRPTDMRREWPGAIPWPAAHPVLVTCVGLAVFCGLVAALRA